MKNNYVLSSKSSEILRLNIQSLLFEPFVTDALNKSGIKKGMNCLDVGCGSGDVARLLSKMVGKTGSVVGIDVERKYLDYCKKVTTQKNVKFFQDNILDSQLTDTFDIVFSRFMFVHLADKKQALRSMIKLTKKNGIVIIQELDNAPGSWLSYPKKDCVEKLRKTYTSLVKKMGGDPHAGRKLFKLFVDEGLQTKVECHSPCIVMNQTPFNELGWRIAKSLKPEILSKKLMSESEFNQLFSDLKEMTKDDACFVTYARFFNVIGKKRN
ncbi:MAG: class I SAM-dependent methyltransferase [Nitrosopumilaceae archaeon]